MTNVMEAIPRGALETQSAGGGVHKLPPPRGEALPAPDRPEQQAAGQTGRSAAHAASEPPPAQPLADMRFKIIDYGHANVRAFRR